MGSVFLIDELKRLGWQKRLAIVMATADPTHRMNFFSTSRSWGVRPRLRGGAGRGPPHPLGGP